MQKNIQKSYFFRGQFIMLEIKQKKNHLYLSVYQYYKESILNGRLLPESRMPSLRRCSQELQISRTTVESAYLALAAEGYIVSRPQSGYYVTEIAKRQVVTEKQDEPLYPEVRYNFTSAGSDKEGFRFDLWRRYIKSALRQNERLLDYGEPQGERELRETLAVYVREHRNVMCSADDIVIGAGIQSLLNILCPLLKERKTVSFPNPSFVQGSTVFEDYGFDVHYRDKTCDVIYVSPAHMTKWGEIMPVSRRLELVRHAQKNGSIIIEDDYENEFVYLQRPTPSLQSLSGGEHVIYMGSFSRLLLPSIRLSFMVLPEKLSAKYKKIAERYNQTASKTEQIALCQFIRDGHLAAQARKLKRLYASKLEKLNDAIREVFGADALWKTGTAGISTALTVSCPAQKNEFVDAARKKGILVEVLSAEEDSLTLVLSCSSIPSEDFREGCEELREVIRSFSGKPNMRD